MVTFDFWSTSHQVWDALVDFCVPTMADSWITDVDTHSSTPINLAVAGKGDKNQCWGIYNNSSFRSYFLWEFVGFL